MLQTSDQLKAVNEPDWRVWQALKREAAARNKLMEDQQSQARWNRKLAEKGSAPKPATIITPVIREKTAEEIAAFNSALNDLAALDGAAEDRAQTRLSALTLQKPTVEEHLKAEQLRRELHKRLADQLLDSDYTARAGSTIHFPSQLISDLMRTAKRVTKQEAEKFTFIAHGHKLPAYKDNTPTELLKKAGLINGEAVAGDLTADEEAELEEYLFNHDLIVRATELAIERAVNNSKISPTELMLALSNNDIKDRKDRVLQTRGREALALNAGLIGGAFGKRKASSFALKSYLTAKENQARFLATHIITNGKISVQLSRGSRTPDKRIAEMYCIAKGMQKHEELNGKSWLSAVCSLQGVYHPNPKFAKKEHYWNGVLPDDAAKELSRRWALVRANLEKIDIKLVGLRTIEAHQDACPHANFLVYYPHGKAAEVERAFRMQFGNTKQAVKIKLDTDQGKNGKSAAFATYALKYFTKYLTDNPDAKVEIESSWRRTHRIRGYAFFGIAPLTHWRLLRKSSKAPEGKAAGDILYDTWKAARDGDFARFLSLTGGTAIKQSHRTIQTAHDISESSRKVAVGVYESTTTVKNVTKIVGGRSQIVRGIKRRVGARVVLAKKVVVSAGDQFITKKLGEWKIARAPATSTEKSEVTVTLSVKLPRVGTSAARFVSSSPPNHTQTRH